MHCPSLAHGRWKLRAHPLSAQVMAAPLSPQTQHCWKEQDSPISSRLRASTASPTPLGRAQDVGIAWSLYTLQSRLADRAHLQSQDFVLEAVGKAAIAFCVSRLS